MGMKQSTPVNRTEFITLDSFYASGYPSRSNVYESRISSSSANKHLVHKTISFTESSQTITRYLSMLKRFGKQIECSNMFLPVLCSVKPSDTVCTDFQILDLYFEHYDIKLKEEIQARRKYRESFSEEEVWYILYSIINGIQRYEKFKISSGNLKTDKILLNDRGHLKVINKLTEPEDSPEERNFQSQRFYAPEELRAIRERIDKKINQNIAQTFAVGIIVLELTTFIPGEEFYDLQRMILNDANLKRADAILARNYSKLLYSLTRTMLSGNYDRPLPSQIYEVFKPHEKRILSLQRFNFQSTNSKLNTSNTSLMSL